MVLAHQAGAALADLEFLQFHPTAVTGIPRREGFLVTEAIRGEGATLHGPDGERFVEELAPARRGRAGDLPQAAGDRRRVVGLDMRHVDPDLFPNVVGALRQSGLDPARELIPVAPAAHYMMGGIVTDLHGRSTLPGLYAVGESACTGLHGANRLASNSLSECFVFGARAARAGARRARAGARRRRAARAAPRRPADRGRRARRCGATPAWSARRRACASCSTTRTRWPGWSPPARWQREESRGAHRRTDFPGMSPSLDGIHTVLSAAGAVALEPWF